MHINVLDLPIAEAILAEAAQPRTAALGFAMSAMPPGTSWTDLSLILEWEERLRRNECGAHRGVLEAMPPGAGYCG